MSLPNNFNSSGFSIHNQEYLLTKNSVNQLKSWPKFKLASYTLYIHKECSIAAHITQTTTIILLGEAYDYRHPEYSNTDIIKHMCKEGTLEEILDETNFLSGVFLIFCAIQDDVYVVPDFCASREAHFLNSSEDYIAVGSSLEILELVKVIEKRNKMISEESMKHEDDSSTNLRIESNHYLDLKLKKNIRFYPYKVLPKRDFDTVIKESSHILPNILKAIVEREKRVMMGLTAGWDSRLLLAASKPNVSSFIFFLNTYAKKNSADTKIAIKLALHLGLTFLSVYTSKSLTSKNFDKIAEFKKNFPYFKSITGGVSETARNFFPDVGKLTGKKLAILTGNTKHIPTINLYDQWLLQNHDIFDQTKYRTLDFFYLEVVLSKRIRQSLFEAHAQNVSMILPFNCRHLIDLFLSIPANLRDKQNSVFHRTLIQTLWAETLHEPINPSIKKRIIQIMQRIKVYSLYRKLLISSQFVLNNLK